ASPFVIADAASLRAAFASVIRSAADTDAQRSSNGRREHTGFAFTRTNERTRAHTRERLRGPKQSNRLNGACHRARRTHTAGRMGSGARAGEGRTAVKHT